MIPLRDERRVGGFPLVNLVLIFANVGIFFYQVFFGPRGFEAYINSMGLVPLQISTHPFRLLELQQGLFPITKIFTAMFMHGGFLHLLGNMWFLWIFGDNIEVSLGHVRFLMFYLLTGVISFLTHIFVQPHSVLPLVGASGAIAGVLGGYFLLFPKNRVLTLVPILFFVTTVQIPAAFFLGLWFLMQVIYSKMGGNVAWWAHIGGFVAGMFLIKFFLPKKFRI